MATNNWMTPLGGTTTGGPTQVSWYPSHVASLSHWYDASLETGSNGSAITSSSDQSGSVNLTASSGVTLLTNWSNSLPAYDFDPTNGNTLSASSVTTLSGAADAWVFSVHDVQNSASNPFLWHYSGTGSADILFSIQYRSNGLIWFRTPVSAIGSTGAGSSASGKSIVGMRTAGSTLHAYQDGTELTLSNPTITSGFPTQTAALMAVGNDNSGNKIDGAVGEVVVGNGALSDGDRETIEGYLAHKWGLTANLPSGHPYKSSPPVWAQASGGTETTSGGYKYHTFTSGGTLTVSSAGNVEYLVVGGGGGGGAWYGGGGGAGGAATGTAALSTGSYSVTIGAGGTAGAHFSTPGGDGADSTFVGTGVSITGGGGGGGGTNASNGNAGGGSGGGGAGGSTSASSSGGAAGTDGASNAGGGTTVTSGGNRGGGGGGGAAAAGTTNTLSPLAGGDGGDGIEWPSGSGTYYAGGGGGGIQSISGTGGSGGIGGGGDGVTEASSAAVDGTANTGGGGGAQPRDGTPGTGGSGIVIVRYKV